DLSVMVVQATGSRRLLASDPASAAKAAELIEHTGREALGELRRLLGTVRVGDDPAPEGVAGLERLAAQARAAGQPGQLDVEGGESELSPGLSMAVHRIVQEALTNAYKHAPGARTDVTLGVGARELALEVSNESAATGAGVPGGGHGLIGMRERALLYDGSLEAGPRAQGGWAVTARLPLGPLVNATQRRSTPR